MEGTKIVLSGIALLALVAAVSFSASRFAGEQGTSEPESEVNEATLGSALSATESEEVDETIEDVANETTEDSGTSDVSVSSSIDIDISTSGDVDSSFDLNVDQSGTGTQGGEGSLEYNGQTLSCPEGEDMEWEDENTEIECENDDGEYEIDVDSDGGNDVKFRWKF